jgi:hypothetical protein
MRHSFHNDRMVTIVVISSKSVELKVKLELCLTIKNRQAHLLHALLGVDQQMRVVDGLYIMRSSGSGLRRFSAPLLPHTQFLQGALDADRARELTDQMLAGLPAAIAAVPLQAVSPNVGRCR